MKMDSFVSKRPSPPFILVFIWMWVSIVAIADASTFSVWLAGMVTTA
jgi:hypothetical protein